MDARRLVTHPGDGDVREEAPALGDEADRLRQRRGELALQRRQLAVAELDGQHARAPGRRQPPRPAQRQPAGRPRQALEQRREDGHDALVALAEERERHVQRLARHRPQRLVLRRPPDQRVDDGRRQLGGDEEPHPSSSRRRRCSATTVERSRISARAPGSITLRVIRRSPVPETEIHTVPTGFSSVPPPGPATPVTPMPSDASSLERAPSASASATSCETAPTRSITASSTPASATLAWLE